MKNYLEFEKDIKTLEDEMEGLDASEVGVSAYPEFSE